MGKAFYLTKNTHDKFNALLGRFKINLQETDRGGSVRSCLIWET